MATLRVDDFLMSAREVMVLACPFADCKWEHCFSSPDPTMTSIIQIANHHLEAKHGYTQTS